MDNLISLGAGIGAAGLIWGLAKIAEILMKKKKKKVAVDQNKAELYEDEDE